MKRFTLPFRFGLVTSACLIAYFLLLALLGKHTNVFFSLFNGVITGFGIYETLKYTKLRQAARFNYTSGFQAGIITGAVATILFTFFFALYATELNPDFLRRLSETWSKDYNNFEAIVFFTVAVMGFATTIVLTLTFMQLFKTSNNPKK
ncbi:hypothetical protein MTsPCn5_22290 [Croceitalea sp. MTPC5]|uniref:DUF4199 domain-containing protein n=1 Tax=Croceitalea sp. MTPC5 TaxID=3056565 RepID=UPI002B39349A|nr:hypothetical protein MTsPCn5_22290 [Croceitalea sp. MTPC5]